MDREEILTVIALGAATYLMYEYYLMSGSATGASLPDALQTIGENVMTAVGAQNWKEVGEGPTYLPYLNQAETQYGIPTDLLARIAYQESHFRADIISGGTRSSAGAVGLMQLLPEYFPGAGNDVQTDINTAAAYLAKLYQQFGDWTVAVAAYNDGPGNVNQVLQGAKSLPLETQNYVSGVFGDLASEGHGISGALYS